MMLCMGTYIYVAVHGYRPLFCCVWIKTCMSLCLDTNLYIASFLGHGHGEVFDVLTDDVLEGVRADTLVRTRGPGRPWQGEQHHRGHDNHEMTSHCASAPSRHLKQ